MNATDKRGTLTSGLALLGIVILLGGCLSSTDVKPPVLGLAGDWSYAGVQTGPVREILSGDLRINGESGTSFQGTLSLEGVNEATGESRMMSGSVSGSGEGRVIDFDANVESTGRRHVGQIVADTITGTWVGSTPGGTITSGTFRAERQ
jgi:hypothetical protein